MQSKFNSRCRLCGVGIHVGDEIAKRSGVWAHAHCPTRPTRTIAESDYVGSGVRKAVALAPSESDFDLLDATPMHEEVVAAIRINPESKPGFTLSQYQRDALDALEHTTSNIVIIAVAGSGKSTLEQIMLYHVPKDKRCVYLAFNKSIRDEFKERKAPEWAEVYTTHSLGLRLLTAKIGKAKLDENKTYKMLDSIYPIPDTLRGDALADMKHRRKLVTQMVSLCKATLTDAHSVSALQAMADRYNIDLNGEAETILPLVGQALDISDSTTALIDFDDMLYLAVKMGCSEQYDYVFVDEAQDLNATQIKFILSLVSGGGRIVAVGDEKQSIYGFRGADTDAMPRLISALAAKVLPLSITYRCPKSHVTLAQSLVPQIRAAESAPDGVIDYIRFDKFAPLDGDLCLSRINAALVGPAFNLIRNGRKAIIRGRDIGENLASTADKIAKECVDMAGMYQALYRHEARAKVQLDSRHASDSQYQALEDKVQTLDAIMGECQNPSDVSKRIMDIFSDKSTSGVTFSSVHRAKGLEAETVYILAPEKMPLVRANQQKHEKQQELNIKYVAITRSKQRLVFVSSD